MKKQVNIHARHRRLAPFLTLDHDACSHDYHRRMTTIPAPVGDRSLPIPSPASNRLGIRHLCRPPLSLARGSSTPTSLTNQAHGEGAAAHLRRAIAGYQWVEARRAQVSVALLVFLSGGVVGCVITWAIPCIATRLAQKLGSCCSSESFLVLM
jgi:hypothetical protein